MNFKPHLTAVSVLNHCHIILIKVKMIYSLYLLEYKSAINSIFIESRHFLYPQAKLVTVNIQNVFQLILFCVYVIPDVINCCDSTPCVC